MKTKLHSELGRREFLQNTALAGLALALPAGFVQQSFAVPQKDEPFDKMAADLLRDWCDAMLALQINNPANPAEHGALRCPACNFIHGRCMDAVYPFLHQAKVSGDRKYLEAGIAVFDWEKNVSQPDGSWTVVSNPKSWRGITVFGAMALAETLHHHGDLLDAATRTRWQARLERAAAFLFTTFTKLDFSNINYGCAGTYALHLLGRKLERPEYIERSRQLAASVKDFLSTPNGLLFGEGKSLTGKSPRGCVPVDIGYNVEESIIALALYADAAGDADFKALITRTLAAHLEFMLPDGAWDNSFGTRQAKWTYWGSRTTDGCQPGYAVLAKENPAFATAVYKNTQLYRRCTTKGLLHGGPHYASHGVPPCVHHTFTHAKALAAVLDHGDLAQSITPAAPLPRSIAKGVREYPEVATWLIARGPWRATLTAYDWAYRPQVFQPTGGTLSMLWHEKAGPLLAGSLAKYTLVEANNMQALPPEGDCTLTPRLECREKDVWFTNLHDFEAKVERTSGTDSDVFQVTTNLRDEKQASPADGALACTAEWHFTEKTVRFIARAGNEAAKARKIQFVLPVISQSGERVIQPAPTRIEIQKPDCRVVIEANAPLHLRTAEGRRAFNLIPGFEAVTLAAEIPPGDSGLKCLLFTEPSL